MIHMNSFFSYFLQTLSTQDFPWMKCNQSWNSETCRPMFTNSTLEIEEPSTTPTTGDYYDYNLDPEKEGLTLNQEDGYYYRRPNDVFPDHEFYNSTTAFDASAIGSTLLFWILLSLPLIQGPKSLIKAFFGGFVIVTICNALLFFLSVSLPGAEYGFAYIFWPNFYPRCVFVIQE